MRNPKNTRTCKGCFQKIDKGNEENSLLQIVNVYDSNKNLNTINVLDYTKKSNIQNSGKKLYVCNNNECIQNMLKRKSISRFFKRNIRDEEIIEIEKYLK